MNFISLQYGTSVFGVEIVKLVKPQVCTVSNLGLLYAQYLMSCGFSYFELFKFRNSVLRFINVGVSTHCVPSSTSFISHSAEVAKTQHPVNTTSRRSCENATSKFRKFWYQYTKRHISIKQLI